MHRMSERLLILACAVVIAGCSGREADATFQARAVDATQMLVDLAFLSADSLEGRLVGSKGSRLARKYLEERFARVGLSTFGESLLHRFDVTSRGAELEGVNVVGYLEGSTTPDWFILVTAHYDHLGIRDHQIYNGADDNASGTAGLMALAAYFADHSPRHSMIFAAVDAEEAGLGGSRALVKRPPVELGRIAVNVNLDMVGHSDHELFVAGTYQSPFLKSFVERVMGYAEVTLLFGHDRPDLGNDDWTNSSDHTPFHEKGIPFLYFGVEDHVDYHKASDEFENINSDFYVKAMNAILGVVLELDDDLQSVIAQRK